MFCHQASSAAVSDPPSPLDRRKTGRSVTGYTSLAGSDPYRRSIGT